MGEITIGEIVRRRPVYVVRQSDSVLDAARYMTEYGVGAVPVLDEGDVVGIISERDVMIRAVAQELDLASTKVGEVMTRKVAVLGEDCTRQEALAVMEQLHIRHLPVMAGKQLTGCISIRELQEGKSGSGKVEVEFLTASSEEIDQPIHQLTKGSNEK